MEETRDLGIKWPQWHTSKFEGEARIDMRYVFPKDVQKMLVQQAMSVCWKKWAAKHEYEELLEGVWLEPALAMLRKKTKEDWTEQHRSVARKWFWKEVGCRRNSSTQVGRMKVSAKHVTRRKAQKSTGSTTAENGTSQTENPRWFQKVEAKSENFKGGVEVAKRYRRASSQ